MNTFQLSAQARPDTGKKATKADRVAGRIPCVIYGRERVEHFTVDPRDVRKLVFTSQFAVVELDIAGSAARAILRDVQYHPTTEAIEHIDFLRVEDGHPLKVSIPLRTEGSSIGVKNGGRLIQSVRAVKVKTLPENLIDELFVDVTKLKLGDAIRVRDITVPDGVEILINGAIPVAMVEIPRALRSANTAALNAEGEEVEAGETEEAAAE